MIRAVLWTLDLACVFLVALVFALLMVGPFAAKRTRDRLAELRADLGGRLRRQRLGLADPPVVGRGALYPRPGRVPAGH